MNINQILSRLGIQRKQIYKINGPIIVYQMSKVGSTSVYESLRHLELNVPLYHAHLLNNLDDIKESILNTRVDPKGSLEVVEVGKMILNEINSGIHKEWNLISLVRDPVRRNISAYFQEITELIPNIYERYNSKMISMDEIIETFYSEFNHSVSDIWFDDQMKTVFDIDVFSTEFPKDKGYKIYQYEGKNLLLIRLENLNNCIKSAMKEFLGINNFKLINRNLSKDKPYNKIYKEFMNTVVLEQDYVNKAYDSKLAKHFYTPIEIEEFKKHWGKQ